MRYLLTTAVLGAFATTAFGDLCAGGSTDDNGNWYCQQVNAITYTGVGGSGSYNKVTNMDSGSGSCSSTPYGYSGSLAPLDEEVSMHFRGPLALKQFAFYAPSPSSSSKARRFAHERRHGHGHAHAHLHKAREAKPEPALGDIVTAVIDGKVETWKNNWPGYAVAPAASSPTPAPAPAQAPPSYAGGSSPPSYSGSDDESSEDTGSGWTRQAYYNAANGTAQGLVFLNHNGGSGSGVFDYSFGNSLSYASSDGSSGASSPQTLSDCTLTSQDEVIIMTDNECDSDGSCGYCRDGTVAYHGFDGPSKAFFFEFGMPSDGQTAANEYDPVNMPAIWMLNAQIPRTLQYGNAECSCWESGCGEFDIFEVLAPGDDRCKSTLHGNVAGGDSDYFARPLTGTMKAALLLYDNNIHIKVLDPDTVFGETMGSTFMNEIISDTMENSAENLVSLFQLSA